MAFAREFKRRSRAAIAPLMFMGVFAYFVWNSTQGDHGLKAESERRVLLARAKAELGRAETDRDGWERRVAGLRTSRLDPDTLDERARAMLNMADPSDIVVPYAPKDRLY